MTTVDLQILDWIQAHLRCGVLDRVVPLVTYLGEGGAIWILLALVLLLRKDTRRYGLGVAVALVLDLVLCNLLLKPLVARPRPFTLRAVTLLVKAPTDWSFPSGHTAASFAAAGALCFGKSKLGAPAVVLATLIGLTRLYLYVHYPSDVVAGVVVGLLCGFLGTFFARKWIELCKRPSK